MHATFIAALAAGALAAPATKTSFSLNQELAGKTFRSGQIENAKAYSRYATKIPANIALASANAQKSGSVTAKDAPQNEEYYCPVTIGTPAQTLLLDFDTGSSDLWVFSSLQAASETKGHTPYNPSKSKSAKLLPNETWSIAYGDGSSSGGVVYADKVVIGKVTATSQSVEAATSVSAEFVEDTLIDGLVGLAFDSLNTCENTPCDTFMENVAPTLAQPLFAAYLGYNKPGAYDFGFVNKKHYTGDITYTDVLYKGDPVLGGFWNIDVTSFVIGSTLPTTVPNTPIPATIVDTGTTLIYLPTDVVVAYYAQVSGATDSTTDGGWEFPCSSVLPSLGFNIGNATFTVPAARMNYAPVETGSKTCFGSLQDSTELGTNILGDAFINNFYVIFDYGSESGTSQVGFALQK